MDVDREDSDSRSSWTGKCVCALRLIDLRTRVALVLLTAGRVAVGLSDLLVAAAMYLLFVVLEGHASPLHLRGRPLTVLSLSLTTAALVILRAVMDSATALLALRRIHSLQTDLLLRLVRGYNEMRWSRFTERNRSELVNSAIHTTREAADFYHRWIELIASVVIVVIMTAAVIWKSRLAAGGIAIMLTFVYVFHRYGIRGSLQTAAIDRESSARTLQRDLADLLSAGKEIRTYRLQSFFNDRIRRDAERIAHANTRALFLPQLGRGMADQGAVMVFLLIIVVVQMGQGDAHQILALLAFYFVLSRRLLPLTSQIALIAGLMESAWENVRVIEAELAECIRYRASELPIRAPSPGYAIEVIGVSFSYREAQPILKDVDFSLSRGEIVVLQGASGIGKSSLLNLIAGVAEPQSGEIRCDRSTICYVPQEVPLLDDSIRNNLLFGLEGVADNQLMDALKIADLDLFVTIQPYGLATSVGDNGSLLSGGQRQRLGVTRALVRGGSTLLLDEATSALDEDSERQIIQALAASGKAVLLVTHRVRTHLFAHRVLHLRDGRLLEDLAYSECK